MKKIVLFLAVFLLVSLIVAGCVKQGQPPGAGPSPSAVASASPSQTGLPPEVVAANNSDDGLDGALADLNDSGG